MPQARHLALAALSLGLASADPRCLWDPAPRPARTSCPLPLDDASPAHELGSAQLQPLKCLRSHSGDLSGKEAVHCIYTALSFRDGFSLAASVEDAANMMGMGGLDSLVAPYTPLHLFSTGAVDGGHGPAYEVVDVPGKGKGAIASREIRKGEVFMVDYPLLLTEGALMADMNAASRKGVLRRAVDGLGEGGRRRALELAKSAEGEDEALDVFITNGCGVEVWGKGYTGLFPEVARMNHDCQPNAYFRFSASTLTMEVLAYRDISPSEEITINYAYLGMPHKERQAFLSETWSFTCICPLCTSSSSLISASDSRRRAIAAKRREISDARREERHPDVTQIAREAAALCEEEGLEALVPEFWRTMAEGYLGMGKVGEASEWAKRTVSGWRAFRGVNSEAFGEAEELVRAIDGERSLG